jgi:Bacterial Ig-like domain (group 2)
MKTTSRRFGRSVAPEVMDDAIGGGDYPVVIHDLSVDSPIAVIPETGSDDLSVPPEPPQDGGADNFWGTGEKDKRPRPWSRAGWTNPDVLAVSPEPPQDRGDDNFWGTGEKDKKPRPWWRARRTYFIATAVIAVLAVVATMLSFSGGSNQGKRVSYTFAVEAFPQAGVTVSRTWTIYGGKHPTLQGDLVFYSSRSDQVTVEELLPKSLVTQASQVTFQPKPHVVSEDPVVVSYSIAPALDGVTSVTYQFPIPGGDISLVALHRWASDQSTQFGQYYLASHQLASIDLTPASIVVKKGGAPYQLAVSGLQSDGQAAPTVAFGSATWSVANPKVAKVSSRGLVSGLTAGKTTVRAVVGKLTATANVVVSAAANVKATPPLKLLTSGSLLSLTPQSFPTSIGVLATGGPAVATHPKKPVPTHKAPVTHPPPPPPNTGPTTNPKPPVACVNPPGPSGVTASAGLDATSVVVSWAPPVVPAGCTLSAYLVSGAGVAPQVVSATSFTFSGLAAGSTVSFAVAAGYTTSGAPVDSAAVGSNPFTLPAAPPPPPVCDATTETAPGPAAALTGNPGEVAVSWSSAGAVSPCSVSSYTVLVDGAVSQSGLTGNATTVGGLTTGTHTVSVTALFADGTSQTGGPVSVDVP